MTPVTVTIDQSVLTAYRGITADFGSFPPFDHEGNNRLPNGSSFDGSATMGGSYTIQVEKGQLDYTMYYAAAQSHCNSLNTVDISGWRIPTMIELYAMYINREQIESSATQFVKSWNWSSSIYQRDGGAHDGLNFADGAFSASRNNDGGGFFVRCVRDFTN